MQPDHSTQLPLAKGVKVVQQTAYGLIALEKPAGVRSHPNCSGVMDAQALLCASYDLQYECFTLPDGRAVYLLNRLDAPTSGLLLATTNADLKPIVQRAFHQKAVIKTYYAWVKGSPSKPCGKWVHCLEEKCLQGRLRVTATGAPHRAPSSKGATAESYYNCIQKITTAIGVVSLLKLQPVTGRTHQLRVQCAFQGHPIIGDQTYGAFGFNRQFAQRFKHKRLFLHASTLELAFDYQGTKQVFKACSELPDTFYTWQEGNSH